MNGDTHGARLFTRYSGSESASDALRLCRETARQDGPGETTVRALGQKVWLTSPAISACWTWPIVPFMLRKTMAHEHVSFYTR